MNRPERFRLPSVDEVLRSPQAEIAIARHGRPATTQAVRQVLENLRQADAHRAAPVAAIAERALTDLDDQANATPMSAT